MYDSAKQKEVEELRDLLGLFMGEDKAEVAMDRVRRARRATGLTAVDLMQQLQKKMGDRPFAPDRYDATLVYLQAITDQGK